MNVHEVSTEISLTLQAEVSSETEDVSANLLG